MFKQPFYHATIRKYVAYFGAIFADITIQRTNSNGDTTGVLKVPLQYAIKEKMLARVLGDPNIDRKDAIALPAMSFELKSFLPDPIRRIGAVNQLVRKDPNNANAYKTLFVPVPYNFSFALYVLVKNAEDGTKIVEQIAPYFTPEWTATLELIPEMGFSQDIPIVLNTVSVQDTFTEDYKDRVTLMYELDFTMKGYLWGPVKDKPLVKFVKTTLYAEDSNSAFKSFTLQPGLLANGQPTSNASLSVNTNTIFVDDNWDYAETDVILNPGVSANTTGGANTAG